MADREQCSEAYCDDCRRPLEEGDVLTGQCWRCSDEPGMIEARAEHPEWGAEPADK